MKPASTISAVLMALAVASTALADDSQYPGEQPLVVGKYAALTSRGFAYMELRGHDYDYRGYLRQLRRLSKADWKHFISKGRAISRYDRASSCRKSSFENIERGLQAYLNRVSSRAELCHGKELCAYAGSKWE